MQASSWNHKLLHFDSNLESVERTGESYKITDYLVKEKSFLDEIKSIFHRFWMAIIWFKNNYTHITNKFGEARS